jgi:hypothetical protein
MTKMIVFALLFVFSAVNAFAVSLEFAFDVNSSGPSIYPCDAGIRHVTHSDRVCYDRVTQNSCNPALCTTQEQCNCVCTGGASNGDGEYRMDFLKTSYADWTENGSYAGASTSASVSATNNNFARIFTNNNEWNKQLTGLSFNLGSERYGTEFYLDVCYRGPQIEYFQYFQGTNVTDTNAFPNFAIKLQATVTDIVTANNIRYSQAADLKVKSEVVCDTQGVGSYVYAHSGTGTYDNALAHQLSGMTGGDKNFSTNYVAFNTGANLLLLNDWINLGNAKTPRFCKIRYSFIENARYNTAAPLAQIRKWANHKARICTYSEISEGAAE